MTKSKLETQFKMMISNEQLELFREATVAAGLNSTSAWIRQVAIREALKITGKNNGQ